MPFSIQKVDGSEVGRADDLLTAATLAAGHLAYYGESLAIFDEQDAEVASIGELEE